MKKQTKRRDLLLILSLLCIGLILFLVMRLAARDGTRVTVSVDNRTVAEYPLSVDGEFSLLDGKNVLVIEDGEIIGAGKHEDLLESCTEYKEISDSQMGGAFLD